MIEIRPIIERINRLLNENSPASVTYAALEARLAIEKVVYDRLRQRHDYISHAQLNAWTPRHVVQRIIAEIDPKLSETVTLSMSREPLRDGDSVEDMDYVKIGMEVGLDSKKLGKLWQALSNLALHVKVPEHRHDVISDYGEQTKIASKVRETVRELDKLAEGTMVTSGLDQGLEVSFVCSCGEKNRRRANLISPGKVLFCFNSACKEAWKVERDGDGIQFKRLSVDISCRDCGLVYGIAWREVAELRYDRRMRYMCPSCNAENIVQWQLMRANSIPNAD